MDGEKGTRKATQVDKGWRARSTDAEQADANRTAEIPGRKATQIDEGWRAKSMNAEQTDANRNAGVPGRKATQIDEGWRVRSTNAKQTDANRNADVPGRKATQIDEGWRARSTNAEQTDANRNADVPGRKATQIDEGWRARSTNAEQADADRKATVPARKATQVDEGWRKSATDMLDAAGIMRQAENHFSSIREFKNAVAKLPQLVSSANNIYPVKRTISDAGGESIVLLCSDPDGNDVAAKVYYQPANSAGSTISARTHVLDYMATEDGKKYTLSVSEIGLVEFGNSKYYFEITPYVADGDVSDDGAFSFDELCKCAKQLNEALHSIHSFGILHLDIKPQNIFKINGRYVLGDFGIAAVVENGKANVTRTRRATDGFASPEICLGLTDDNVFIYDAKCDYYAFGITLACLYEGNFIYDGMSAAAMLVSVRNGVPPLTRADSVQEREELENLICGLCKYDPRYRFGYEDVSRWLIDHKYTGGMTGEEWPKAYSLLGSSYRDEKSLFLGITQDEAHWNKAREMLYRKYFEDFFRSFKPDLADSARMAEEQYRNTDGDKGLAVFLKCLFAPGQIVWKGYTFNGLQDLGNKMVAAENPAAFGEILRNRCISHWLANTEGISADEHTREVVDDIEALSADELEIACYWFGNSFAEKKRLTICGQTVSTIPSLIKAMFDVPAPFYHNGGSKKLLDRKDGADLYGFLFSFGYKKLIDAAWEHANQCDTFNKACLLFSMMEQIAVKANAVPEIVRNFFVKYGPIGIASYTRRLLMHGKDVYIPMDVDGKQALSDIANFQEPSSGTVYELFRAYMPLMECVNKLQELLTDNPFCITTGTYEKRGVICGDLMGCFAFNIFERSAPLGFSAYIDTVKGGSK